MIRLDRPSANDAVTGSCRLYEVTIPDPVACLPRRARFRGGRHHRHPSHTSLVVDSAGTPSIADHERSCGLTIASREPRCAVTFRERQPTFAGLSRKTRRMVSGRGPHEYAAFRLFEMDTGIVDYVLQGTVVTIRFADGEAKHYSDYITVDENCSTSAGEIKADASHFAPPAFRHRMELCASAYATHGISFRRDTGASLRGSARFELNLGRAFGDRFTRVEPARAACVAETLARGAGEAALGAIEELLDSDPLAARAKAHALMCTRALHLPLAERLGKDTRVTVPKYPKSVPDIRAIGASATDF